MACCEAVVVAGLMGVDALDGGARLRDQERHRWRSSSRSSLGRPCCRSSTTAGTKSTSWSLLPNGSMPGNSPIASWTRLKKSCLTRTQPAGGRRPCRVVVRDRGRHRDRHRPVGLRRPVAPDVRHVAEQLGVVLPEGALVVECGDVLRVGGAGVLHRRRLGDRRRPDHGEGQVAVVHDPQGRRASRTHVGVTGSADTLGHRQTSVEGGTACGRRARTDRAPGRCRRRRGRRRRACGRRASQPEPPRAGRGRRRPDRPRPRPAGRPRERRRRPRPGQPPAHRDEPNRPQS